MALPAQTASIDDASPFLQSGRRWVVGGLLCLLCAGILLYLSPALDDAAYWPAMGIVAGIASLSVIAMLRFFGFAWQSAPVAYLAFLWMFHFPLTLFLHLIPNLWAQLSSPVYAWTQSATWYRGSLYALLCVIAFAIGCGLASGAQSRAARADQPNALRFYVGIATAVAGLVWLYYLAVREGGLDLFGSGYAQMFKTEFGSSLSNAIFLVSIGCVLAFLSAPGKLIWLPVAFQLAGSVPVLLTGSRQFALIGPLVLAVVAAKRGIRLGFVRTGVSCVLVLWMISYVGETRSHGVMEGVVGSGSVSPVNALVEMGSSLQTTSLAIDWIQNGDSYLWGGSYWLPLERGLGLVLPMRKDLATDPRAMHMVMVSRVSGLGGSAIAESFYNFSVLGSLTFLVLGYLLARLERNALSPLSASFMGVVLYAFVFQARNWFINVPNVILIGSVPLIVCLCLEAVLNRKRNAVIAEAVYRPLAPGSPMAGNWPAGGRG
jgi:hypothetical protein